MSFYIIAYIDPRTALIKPVSYISWLSFDDDRLVCTVPSPTNPYSFSYSLFNCFLNILLFYYCMKNYSKTCHFKTTNIYYLTLVGPGIWALLVQGLSQAIYVSARAAVTSRLKTQSGTILSKIMPMAIGRLEVLAGRCQRHQILSTRAFP